MSDVLWREIVQTRVLESFDCLKLIADILRFILTLFVHEQVNDYRLLYAILETAMQTSVSRDKATKRPKQSLAVLLFDHGIWSEKTIWTECIEFVINQKLEDFQRR